MREYMNNEVFMRAKAEKVIREGQFSMVDSELDDLHKTILNQTALKVLDERYDAHAIPFQAFQDDIINKGKDLQFKSAKFVANKLIRPEINLKSKETQTKQPDPLEVRISELELYNENLEDKLKSKENEIENISYTCSKLSKEKIQLKDEIKILHDKEDANLFTIEDLKCTISRKLKTIEEFTIEVQELKKEVFLKNK